MALTTILMKALKKRAEIQVCEQKNVWWVWQKTASSKMTNLLRTSKRSKMQISNVRLDKVSTINEQNWAVLTKKRTHIQFAYIFATSTAYSCMSFSALLFLLQLWLSDLFVCVHKIILLHILWRDKWYFGDFHAEMYITKFEFAQFCFWLSAIALNRNTYRHFVACRTAI